MWVSSQVVIRAPGTCLCVMGQIRDGKACSCMHSLADLQTNPCIPEEMWMKEHWENLYQLGSSNNLERKGFVVSLCIRVLTPSCSMEACTQKPRRQRVLVQKIFSATENITWVALKCLNTFYGYLETQSHEFAFSLIWIWICYPP